MYFLISYDLKNKSTETYQDLFKKLESFEEYRHILESGWIIKSNKNVQQVYEEMLPYFKSNDRFFINKLADNIQGFLDDSDWKWIESL